MGNIIMSNRITVKFLRSQADNLNFLTQSPAKTYVKQDGKLVGQIGNFYISEQNNGYSLVRVTNEGGACTDIFRKGHIPARELSGMIDALMVGYQLAND